MESVCLNCNATIKYFQSNRRGKYCSNQCQQDYSTKKKILENTASWKTVRSYLIKNFGARCMECGWDKVNPVTQKCPIEIDHIDGNSNNNALQNCRLLCPNCHALTPTYKALNVGKGRKANRERYHKEKRSVL